MLVTERVTSIGGIRRALALPRLDGTYAASPAEGARSRPLPLRQVFGGGAMV